MYEIDKVIGDMREIKEAYDRLDLDFINSFILKLINSEKIELEHPFFKGIITLVKNSVRIKEVNVVFLTDVRGGSRWCFVQSTNFIDAIFIEEEVFILHESAFPAKVLSAHNLFIKNKNNYSRFFKDENVFGGFVISHKRPFHYIYDFLRNVHLFSDHIIKSNKKIISEGGEFLPISKIYGIQYKKSENEFYLYISSIQAFKAKALNSQNVYDMEECILNAVEPSNLPVLDKSDFILWIGITGQKRSWIQQIDGYKNIINRVAETYSNVLVLVDGMTSYYNQEDLVEEDSRIFESISKLINPNIKIKSLIGIDYFRKIALAKRVDFFISNGGSGSIVPDRICKLPGVMHSSKDFWTFGYNKSKKSICIPKDSINDLPLHSNLNSPLRSYFIEWSLIFNFMSSLVPAIGNEKKLEVDDFDSQQSMDIFFKETFRFFSCEIFSEQNEDVILKKLARKFEIIGDSHTSKKLLEIAGLF